MSGSSAKKLRKEHRKALLDVAGPEITDYLLQTNAKLTIYERAHRTLKRSRRNWRMVSVVALVLYCGTLFAALLYYFRP